MLVETQDWRKLATGHQNLDRLRLGNPSMQMRAAIFSRPPVDLQVTQRGAKYRVKPPTLGTYAQTQTNQDLLECALADRLRPTD